MKKKTIALLMAAVMLVGVVVGGTVAWLTAETTTVENTFVVGNIAITLDEADVNIETTVGETTTYTYTEYVKDNEEVDTLAQADRVTSNKYKIIPGTTYSKDPTVVVKANSEDCYLFVKFEEIGNPSKYYTYTSNLSVDGEGWTALEGVTGVWYRKVSASTSDQPFYLLDSIGEYDKGAITVKTDVTLSDMDGAKAASLKWTAYAVQQANMTSAADAWKVALDATVTQ